VARPSKKTRSGKKAKKTSAKRTCTKCWRPAAAGRRQCRYHLAYFREYRRKRRQDGKCIHCAAPSGGYQLCDDCASRSSDLMRRRYYERRKAGLCVACGAPADGYSLCEKCSARKARARATR
jgi:hypothetical protein